MAVAVEFREFTPKNARNDLVRRLEQAPEQHAEAILASYDLLQRMHEKGLIDLANGLLSASDTVVERVTDVISSEQAIKALRLALIFGNLINDVDPDRVAAFFSPQKDKRPTFGAVLRKAVGGYVQLVIVTCMDLFKFFGASLRTHKPA